MIKNQDSAKKSDVIQIPIGSLEKFRKNPWLVSTFVLAFLLIGVLAFGSNIGKEAVVSEEKVGADVLKLLQSKVTGEVEINSITRESGLYRVNVMYQGQEVPIYATLDGKNLVSDLIPIDETSVDSIDEGNTGSTGGSVTSVDISGANIKGNENAPITIIEFSDFECPFCARFYTDTFSQIEKEYIDTGKVKVAYMHFPLGFHSQAGPAAEASECAAEQGKFWEMHDKLFENSPAFSDSNYKVWAKEIGLNEAQFNDCLDNGKYATKVNAELTYGSQLGVSGTPGFFVGNEETGYVVISGAQPFSVFKQVIDSQLD